MQQSSKALRRSFLALTVRYTDHNFFCGAQTRASDFYKTSASEILFAQAAEPTGDLEILQAFTLLCLTEISSESYLVSAEQD